MSNDVLAGFFDVASQLGLCGCGICLRFNGRQSVHIRMVYEEGTNIRGESLALWTLLKSSSLKGIDTL